MRRQLTTVIGELDRRRHELFDWKLQVRKHKRGLALAGAVVALGGIGLAVSRRRERRRRDASGTGLLHKVALAALGGMASAVAKRALAGRSSGARKAGRA